jgi:hypothetical protein
MNCAAFDSVDCLENKILCRPRQALEAVQERMVPCLYAHLDI